MILTYVPPQDLHKVWDKVRLGILATKRKVKTRYIPEDVYTGLRNNTATLWLIADKGFCVLQERQDTDGKNLHVWWLYCPGMKELHSQFITALDDIAMRGKFRRITADSPRGFDAKGYFAEVTRSFEREINYA